MPESDMSVWICECCHRRLLMRAGSTEGWVGAMARSSMVRVGVVVSIAVAVSMVGATPAMAKPGGGKPIGPVKGLEAHVSHPGSGYDVDAAWTALSSASKYVVKMTDSSGHPVGGGTVTSPAWSGTTPLPAMQSFRVTVTPYKGT